MAISSTSKAKNLNLQAYLDLRDVGAIVLHMSNEGVNLQGIYSRIVRALCELYMHQHSITPIDSTESAISLMEELGFDLSHTTGSRRRGLLSQMQKEALSKEIVEELQTGNEERKQELTDMFTPKD